MYIDFIYISIFVSKRCYYFVRSIIDYEIFLLLLLLLLYFPKKRINLKVHPEDEQIRGNLLVRTKRSQQQRLYTLAVESETSLWSGIDSVGWKGEYHRDLDTMDRWSVAEIGKHWLSVTDLSTDFTRSVHRIGASNRPSCPR